MVCRTEHGQALIELLIGCTLLLSLALIVTKIQIEGLNLIDQKQFNNTKGRPYEFRKNNKHNEFYFKR